MNCYKGNWEVPRTVFRYHTESTSSPMHQTHTAQLIGKPVYFRSYQLFREVIGSPFIVCLWVHFNVIDFLTSLLLRFACLLEWSQKDVTSRNPPPHLHNFYPAPTTPPGILVHVNHTRFQHKSRGSEWHSPAGLCARTVWTLGPILSTTCI